MVPLDWPSFDINKKFGWIFFLILILFLNFFINQISRF